MCVLEFYIQQQKHAGKNRSKCPKLALHTTQDYVSTRGQDGDKANKPNWISSGCIFLWTTAKCFRNEEGRTGSNPLLLQHIYFSNCTWFFFWIISKNFRDTMKTVFQRDFFFACISLCKRLSDVEEQWSACFTVWFLFSSCIWTWKAYMGHVQIWQLREKAKHSIPFSIIWKLSTY